MPLTGDRAIFDGSGLDLLDWVLAVCPGALRPGRAAAGWATCGRDRAGAPRPGPATAGQVGAGPAVDWSGRSPGPARLGTAARGPPGAGPAARGRGARRGPATHWLERHMVERRAGARDGTDPRALRASGCTRRSSGMRPRTLAVLGFTASPRTRSPCHWSLPVAGRRPILGIAAPWWVFVLMYGAAEAFPVHLEWVARRIRSRSTRCPSCWGSRS